MPVTLNDAAVLAVISSIHRLDAPTYKQVMEYLHGGPVPELEKLQSLTKFANRMLAGSSSRRMHDAAVLAVLYTIRHHPRGIRLYLSRKTDVCSQRRIPAIAKLSAKEISGAIRGLSFTPPALPPPKRRTTIEWRS